MLAEYMKRLTKGNEQCPVVLSITDTTSSAKIETVIHRNNVIEGTDLTQPTEIYVRAREIYFRARRQRPVRAASIF